MNKLTKILTNIVCGAFPAIFLISILGIDLRTAAQDIPQAAQPPQILIPYRKGAKWGFSDHKKRIVIRPIYDWVGRFRESLAKVALNARAGYIDTTGKVVIPITFKLAQDFYDGRAVAFDKYYGFIDKTGKFVIPNKYAQVHEFREGLAAVQLPGGKFEYIDTTGKKITEPKYDTAYDFYDGMARVAAGNGDDDGTLYGFIDKSGKEIIPLKYHSANDFSEGLAQVQALASPDQEYLYYSGFIDITGAVIIPFEYLSTPWNFSEGLVFVNKKDIRTDLIVDKTGKVILKDTSEYYIAGAEFHEGLARVFLNNKIGFIDRAGKIVIPLKYDRPEPDEVNFAENFADGIVAVCHNHKFGLIDMSGKEITRFKYATIQSALTDGLVYVCLDKQCNKGGYLGLDGTEYFEL